MKNENKKIAVELLKENRDATTGSGYYLLADGSVHHQSDNNNEIETFIFSSSKEIREILMSNEKKLRADGFVKFIISNDGTPYFI